jgi:hypothetical protein
VFNREAKQFVPFQVLSTRNRMEENAVYYGLKMCVLLMIDDAKLPYSI